MEGFVTGSFPHGAAAPIPAKLSQLDRVFSPLNPHPGASPLPSPRGAGGCPLHPSDSIWRRTRCVDATPDPRRRGSSHKPAACVFLRRAGSWPILGKPTQLARDLALAEEASGSPHPHSTHAQGLYSRAFSIPRAHPGSTHKTNPKQSTHMKTEYRCPECGASCTASFDNHWLECPHCSRISRDFKPPDRHPAGDWDFPDVDGVVRALCAGSLTEHAYELTLLPER